MNRQTIEGIAGRTQLVTLNMRAFRPVKLHKPETREENARHRTDAAKVLVRISNHEALRALTSIHQAAYSKHRELTLPTIQDGMRLVPCGRQMEHATAMHVFSTQHDDAVARFVADYDNERASAPARLNGLFDPSMWPTSVAHKFGFESRYLSCPTDGAWVDWIAESCVAAENEIRDRVTEALRRVVDRCKSDGKLYATVFTDLRALADMLPDLNVTNAPDLTQIASTLATLGATDVEHLRDNDSARMATAQRASEILAAFA